ncbi:MAG: hypothetical protein WC614_05960 [bacterium]
MIRTSGKIMELLFIGVLILVSGCAARVHTQEELKYLSMGMSKKEVSSIIGKPNNVVSWYTNERNQKITTLVYKLKKESDIGKPQIKKPSLYRLYFVNDKLKQVKKVSR